MTAALLVIDVQRGLFDQADAHTTHGKPHASASTITAHENATLPSITSFGPRIIAVPGAQVQFSD